MKIGLLCMTVLSYSLQLILIITNTCTVNVKSNATSSIDGSSSGALSGGMISLIVVFSVAIIVVTSIVALVLVARRRPDLVPERLRGWMARLPAREDSNPTGASTTTTPIFQTNNSLNDAGSKPPAANFGTGFEPTAL